MTTRAQLMTSIRAELNDSGGTKLWSDGLLQGWIGEAIRDYSERLPKEATTTWVSVANQSAYSLPNDFARALRVEHPANYFRVYAPIGGGDVLPGPDVVRPVLASQQLTYDVFGGNLVLEPVPDQAGETITLRYLAVYAEPAADGDTLATPSRDDELLIWLVCSRALDWITTDESKRMRYERVRGASATGQGDRYQGRYLEGVRLRQRLLRTGRRLVVRGEA